MTRFARRLAGLLGLCAPALLVGQARQDFPHDKHARVFPSCVGCHVGIVTGEATRSFPADVQCASCHDGRIQKVVGWREAAPKAGAGLLAFSHAAHARKAGTDATCQSCHSAGTATPWMTVSRAPPERCASCHAHGQAAHLADENTCATCHRTLAAATGLDDRRIAALPTPPSHGRTGWDSSHGTAARASTASCAMCHARESCARCHVDATRSATIATLAPDARVARFVAGRPPVYSTPVDHRTGEFSRTHGVVARESTARCATCHARPSCATCHTSDGARDVIAQLPDGAEAKGRGVRLRLATEAEPPVATIIPARMAGARPAWNPAPHPADSAKRVRVHPGGFVRSHGTAAATEAMSCAGCHARRFCTDCHAGEKVTRRYHPSNFVSGHPAKAYGRDTDCASCHSTEAFCRDCHKQLNLGTRGIRGSGFHNAQPRWLLQHGRAARQEMTTCASCHQQRDCQQCHSQLGWRVNPHGPDFDAVRMHARNRALCLRCHFKDPLGS